MHRRANSERARAEQMSPRNQVIHFAILKKKYDLFNIRHAAQRFNLYDTVFSSLNASRARATSFIRKEGKCTALDLQSSSNVEHVTLMPVVSADGKARNPIAILHVVQTKGRVLQDGVKEKASSFLLPNTRFLW